MVFIEHLAIENKPLETASFGGFSSDTPTVVLQAFLGFLSLWLLLLLLLLLYKYSLSNVAVSSKNKENLCSIIHKINLIQRSDNLSVSSLLLRCFYTHKKEEPRKSPERTEKVTKFKFTTFPFNFSRIFHSKMREKNISQDRLWIVLKENCKNCDFKL